MAYKFQLGTARLSGALEQEGNISVATGSSEVIGVESTLGSNQFFASVKYDGAAESGILEVTTGSNGAVNFFAGANSSYVAQLSGAAMDTLAGAALDFDQSTGIMDVTNTGIAGLISEDVVDLANDSIVYFDSSGVLQRDRFTDYATKLAAGNGLQAGGGALAIDISEFSAVTPAASDSFLTLDSNGSTEQLTTTDALATLFAGAGLGASSAIMEVEVSGALKVGSGIAGKVGISGSIAGAGLSHAGGVDSISSLAVDSTELAAIFSAADIDVANDSIIFIDANDSNDIKQESVPDLATRMVAGTNGLAASSGVLSIDISEFSAVTPTNNDSLLTLDSDGSTEQLTTTQGLATLFAGAGLGATDAVMEVEVSGALKVGAGASGKVGISGSIAGDGLAFAGGQDSISALSLDLNELTAADVALNADSFAFIDANDNNAVRKESFADFATALVNITNGGLQDATGQIALDLNDLAAATILESADSIPFIDADGNVSRKDTIVSFADKLAGAGLAASNGKISVQSNNVTNFSGNHTAVEGFNYADSDFSSDVTVTLPASPTAGDVVRVKAKNLTAGANIVVQVDGGGSHKIDVDQTSIRIESPYGAIACVYVDTNDWRIF